MLSPPACPRILGPLTMDKYPVIFEDGQLDVLKDSLLYD